LAGRDLIICRDSSGSYFALDSEDRWISLVSDVSKDPRDVASHAQSVIREIAGKLEMGGVYFDVDLICSHAKLIESIRTLGDVVELSVTLKRPNQGDIYDDEYARMEALRARRLKVVAENPEGLHIPRRELTSLAGGLETGEVEVAARSARGDEWSSVEDPEQYAVPRGLERVPVALLLALVWIIDVRWPGGGGPV
jgi:hypothetical protein